MQVYETPDTPMPDTPLPDVPLKDQQTVTQDGDRLAPLIDGVIVRNMRPQQDERGEICEIYDPRWGVMEAPLVYVYQATLMPGEIRGWVVHRKQDDRLFVSLGRLRIVLYDDRPTSPSHGMINKFTITERNRALVVIPHGVFHAVQNVGVVEALFVNMPTIPYIHEDPDKYRLPLTNSLIPFDFDKPFEH